MSTVEHAALANMSIFSWPQKLHDMGYTESHSLLPGTLKWLYLGFLAFLVLIVGAFISRPS